MSTPTTENIVHAPGDLRGKRVTVMGLGRFGGGLGAAKWLVGQGAIVTVTDIQTAEKLKEPVAEIQPLVAAGKVTLHLGGHVEADFTGADLVVANPAVPRPWENAYLRAAEKAGVRITTEIGLLVERLPVGTMTIGVTGSVGKSTTTAMIAHALKAVGYEVMVGGNIGGSLLEMVNHTPSPGLAEPRPTSPAGSGRGAQPIVALELSSFMLYWLGRAQGWSPRVAVVTNIGDNHTDWHGSMGHYVGSKQELVKRQHAGDVVVLGPGMSEWAGLTPARRMSVDRPLDVKLMVPGAHNRLNAAVALEACVAAAPESDRGALVAALGTFPGLEHRLQLCHESGGPGRGGRRFFNDSKCTTPEATMKALESLAEEAEGRMRHIHLIAGGYDKKADLSGVSALAGRLGGLYCIGATGRALAMAADRGYVERCEKLEEAVAAAVQRMKAGDVLLLSPACASWDQFINYEYRGKRFVELVKELAP